MYAAALMSAAAALMSAEATSKTESAGLLAHMYNVLQLAKELGGNQWLQYDKSFREWATAKDTRVWGDLNLLSLFGIAAENSPPMVDLSSPPGASAFQQNGHPYHIWVIPYQFTKVLQMTPQN